MKRYQAHYRLFLVLIAFCACRSSRVYQSSVSDANDYHSSYDDTTLTVDNASVLMPYNRFIDPAGTVIRFGKTSLENHSLDCVLTPDEKTLIVEDRYGLAFIEVRSNQLLYHLDYTDNASYKSLMSTYSGLKVWQSEDGPHIFWGAANPSNKTSFVMDAVWDGKKATIKEAIPFKALAPAPMSLPNDIAIRKEGNETFLFVVLNGNSQLAKLNLKDKKTVWTTASGMAPFGLALTQTKAYVSNWAGAVPVDASKETAGIPYAKVYVDPRTGATSSGTVSVIDLATGKVETEIEVGLHPNSIIASKDGRYVYVANGNSDNISIINTAANKVVNTVSVKLNEASPFIGDSPNALALSPNESILYVSNGMNNAVAVMKLSEGGSKALIEGFIPTEAYPAGLVATDKTLFVANLEGEGARASTTKTYGSHQQEATISIIPVPDKNALKSYSTRVEKSNLLFRTKLSQLTPRKNTGPKPVPERIGEPSVFKHVLYVIKENKTYDQVMGDVAAGNGIKSLCIYGDSITPNQHRLVKDFLLLDNYYVAGKSSAEGHSWTDAAIVTDYVEKNVRAWFRSYPHVLADALVYNKAGFIWNNALDHGKTVRIYGEACTPTWKAGLGWKEFYDLYKEGKPISFTNHSTISRVEPVLSPAYPCFEGQNFNDQIRADAFIKELHDFEKMPGDQLPQLMVMALPADHTAGMREGFPTPRAMVADNDLALGRILEALTKSRFWDSTVVFVTEDDSQSGWDHVSAYRTTAFIISPYSRLQKTVHTNYNQTSMVRTIEQILGLPPMNVVDATALPMFDCFTGTFNKTPYAFIKNNIPLNEMNKPASTLKGKAKRYTELSGSAELAKIDSGNDDLLNRILWFDAMGNKPYPKKMTLSKNRREPDND
ncbi:YncE family protein [Flavisolibacter ginsenosidimutans]|uniref:Beta-propeller fold lactonase family protein n=1 Tax=Flavisolibacter ginsenosidimutans TaxID=661481 RepID=A0A5B8UDC1_9BACT|nr:YncE family protein [Flavisolibacter ginsenosidimutans]QEC54564.1 beta-propeller fold lactonase family protein [Flavisolibacter ginsenosidimutans]